MDTNIYLSGTSYTVSESDFAYDRLRFTGVLTANINVIVPSVPNEFLVTNNVVAGGFTVTVKTASAAGVVIPNGATVRLISDGASVSSEASTSGLIVGTGTNDNAVAGTLGEYVSAQVLIASPVALTTATAANLTSISLTAGDWDVDGIADFVLTGATTTDWAAGISTTTATLGAQDTYMSIPVVLTTHTDNYTQNTPTVRLSLAATTTVYLIGRAAFSAGTIGGAGILRARRVR